jgi:hypothetical protein
MIKSNSQYIEQSTPSLEVYKIRLERIFDLDGGIEAQDTISGNVLEIKAWTEDVLNGHIIDYDGHGYFLTKRCDGVWLRGRQSINPSDISYLKLAIPQWVTHIEWFNK